MQPTVLLIWMLTVILDTAGQLSFKAAAADPDAGDGWARWKHMLARPWLWLGGTCYVFEFLAWIAFLTLVPLGRGLLLGSINIVVIMLGGRLLFRERLTPMRVLGIVLITFGVALVGVSA